MGISHVVVVMQGLCGCTLVATQGVGAHVVVARAVATSLLPVVWGLWAVSLSRKGAVPILLSSGGSGPCCCWAWVWWPCHYCVGALWNLSVIVMKWAVCPCHCHCHRCA